MDKHFFIFILFICLSWSLPSQSLSPSDLTLEEKVGQLLMVHFHGRETNEDARYLIQGLHVGGIIYYQWANDLSHPLQVQKLSHGLQLLAQEASQAIPLLIAIDQEGGRVSRLKQGFTVFPGNYALGQTGEWSWGEESAWMVGQELRAVGISLNLAPVVDIYTQPANPIIGIRAFSSSPSEVARWGSCALRGYKRAGLIAALKHFPGHGDVKVDSHEALPIVNKKREVLEQVELYPFRSLAPQADVIMTAHLLVPALDTQCVTFSRKVVHDLLRKDFNFQGVIMTDSLAMEGILSQCSSLEEAVLKSLEAGHDLVLLGGKQLLASQNGLEFGVDDVRRVHRFLVNAVRQGHLSEDRLNESVARILALKQKYELSEILNTEVRSDTHRMLAQLIAKRALHLVRGNNFTPLTFDSSVLIVAPDCLRDELAQTAWQTTGAQIIFFEGLNPDQATIEAIKLAAEKGGQCLYFAYNAWQFIGQQTLFQQIKKVCPKAWVIVVRDPLDADCLSTADLVLCTFSPVACSLQAAFDYLKTPVEGKKL